MFIETEEGHLLLTYSKNNTEKAIISLLQLFLIKTKANHLNKIYPIQFFVRWQEISMVI